MPGRLAAAPDPRGGPNRSRQRGLAVGYILFVLGLLALTGMLLAKRGTGQVDSINQVDSLRTAGQVIDSANEIRLSLSMLYVTYGNSIDPQISSNQISSVSSAWPATPAPLPAGAGANWTMSNGNRLAIGSVTKFLATLDLDSRTCTSINGKAAVVAPTISSAGNGYGGTTYTANFGANAPSDIFCIEGGGSGGRSRVYLGL